jgi:galactose mutarotase-like enzyme
MISVNNKVEDPASILLRSEELEVVIVPAEGGRIASLRSVRTGVEFLTQARSNRQPIEPSFENLFQYGPCAGAEECLPTVGPCEDCSGGPAPDHGDFWQLPWHVDSFGDRQLNMQALGFSRPLRFARELRVDGASLFFDYTVTNAGSETLPFLYAWHPLFAVEEGDRVVLPAEVDEVKLFYSRTEDLRCTERILMWPIFEDDSRKRDLSVAPAPGAGTAEMIYTQRLHVGRCGLFRKTRQHGLVISFDPNRLPYLGVWACFSGWPLTGNEPKQVAIALEPTTAPFNTLSNAEAAGMAANLEPGSSFRWNLQVDIVSPGISYNDFRSVVQQAP